MNARLVLARTTGQELRHAPADRVAAQARDARAALAEAFRRARLARGPLLKDEREAPIPSRGVHWSLSHTRTWVAAALDPRGPVGVDVERLRVPRGPREAALDDAERDLFGLTSLELAFARCWTAKECVLKVAGVGLLELGQCRLVEVTTEGDCLVEHRGAVHRVRQRMLGDHVLAVSATSPLLWHGLPQQARSFEGIGA